MLVRRHCYATQQPTGCASHEDRVYEKLTFPLDCGGGLCHALWILYRAVLAVVTRCCRSMASTDQDERKDGCDGTKPQSLFIARWLHVDGVPVLWCAFHA